MYLPALRRAVGDDCEQRPYQLFTLNEHWLFEENVFYEWKSWNSMFKLIVFVIATPDVLAESTHLGQVARLQEHIYAYYYFAPICAPFRTTALSIRWSLRRPMFS